MKVILSRKGFDSSCGGQASPVLPDRTLLSLPIPSNDEKKYKELCWEGLSYLEIIKQLNPKTTLNESSHCHLDPDLRNGTLVRGNGWKPAFGQTGSLLTELRENGVKEGDLFLFFGWFKQTEYCKGGIRYVPKSPDLHVIYGYMQIDGIVESIKQIPKWLRYHPHANFTNYKDAWSNVQNAIYLSTDRLSFAPKLSGSGIFSFRKDLVLTKAGYSRSRWDFPASMRGTPISHNPNGWKPDYFQSAARGQEFVMDCTPEVMEWVNSLFNLVKL